MVYTAFFFNCADMQFSIETIVWKKKKNHLLRSTAVQSRKRYTPRIRIPAVEYFHVVYFTRCRIIGNGQKWAIWQRPIFQSNILLSSVHTRVDTFFSLPDKVCFNIPPTNTTLDPLPLLQFWQFEVQSIQSLISCNNMIKVTYCRYRVSSLLMYTEQTAQVGNTRNTH